MRDRDLPPDLAFYFPLPFLVQSDLTQNVTRPISDWAIGEHRSIEQDSRNGIHSFPGALLALTPVRVPCLDIGR